MSIVRRIETETGHWYQNTETGNPIPGVTTILKVLPKAKLDDWKLKKAVDLALKGEKHWKEMPDNVDKVSWLIEAGDREALTAAGIGTKAHNFAEKHMLGEEPDLENLKPAERHHVECYLQFCRDYLPDPVLVEKVLVYIDPKSGQPLYAGTMDLVAKLTWNPEQDPSCLPDSWEDGLIWSIDYKASSKQPRPSHALQASAYTHATHWIDDDTDELVPMPKADQAAVVLLNGGGANRCYRMHRLDAGPVTFSVFKSLLRIYNFSKIEDRIILEEM